ncbi:transmembrane protease serine 9-like [Cimex lectularius]|uniref:Peptidase S1 domain-containing protein n=1 Tax=Cimex lectularius TaxID=79782 RepID=A0A8I6RV29_CIMLE|nr:transmembrane protease serine 9-like [Cimex lectularius]
MKTLCALFLALLLPEGLLTQKCGESVASRIVGGTKANTKQYPYYTGLIRKHNFNRTMSLACGGSLIRSNKVLTAAHCYDKSKTYWMTEYVAVFDIQDRCNRQYGGSSDIIHVEMHPLWNTNTFNCDLAIATLKDNVQYDTICLSPKGYNNYPTSAYIIGLGRTHENGSAATVCHLLQIYITIFTRDTCLTTDMAGIVQRRAGIVCAGDLEGTRSSCQGDSGGPLIRVERDVHYLQGIVSTGVGCGRRNSPGIYSDVTAHRIWIDRVLKKASQTNPASGARPTDWEEGQLLNMPGRRFIAIFSICLAALSTYAQFTDLGSLGGSPFFQEQFRCPFCYCGRTMRVEDGWGRIVGGWPTKPREYPWMVALVTKEKNRLFCGASIISDIYVLTAAHCVRGKRRTEIQVVLSDGDHVDMEPGMAERRDIARIIVHKEFHQPRRYNNDIALLKLTSAIKIGFERPPVCLPIPGHSFAGDMGRVLGWGLTAENGTKSSWLQEASVPILSSKSCSSLSGFMSITPGMMCAAPLSGGVDACQGDSGGPLLVQEDDGRIVIAGIVSWGIGCARPNKPGIYTRVNHYIQWIVDHTKDGCYCF